MVKRCFFLAFSFNGLDGPSSSRLGSPGSGTRPVIRRLESGASPQRRYPTHLPQFSGVGILPTVKLCKPARSVLGEHNSSMVTQSPVGKIAPPDSLKPPIPVLVHICDRLKQLINQSAIKLYLLTAQLFPSLAAVHFRFLQRSVSHTRNPETSNTSESSTQGEHQDPCSAESVISALREKR